MPPFGSLFNGRCQFLSLVRPAPYGYGAGRWIFPPWRTLFPTITYLRVQIGTLLQKTRL